MRSIVTTKDAPRPIGPYSQAVISNGFVFVSGQTPLDPRSGDLVPGGVAEQATRVLQNIAGILTAAGTSPENIIKTTVFLVDMDDFALMNEVYARFSRMIRLRAPQSLSQNSR
jgi:2-iminobutanoate/2-iminopropanoate deaminase